MTAEPLGHAQLPDEPEPSLEELLREAGSRPVVDFRELAIDGFFASDAEFEDFLRFYRDQRR